MTHSKCLWLLAFVALASAAPAVRAQDDPFKIDAGDDPFKAGDQDKPAPPAVAPEQPGPKPPEEDPIADALKPKPGAGPVEILRSIRLLTEIDRADLAKSYLEELTKRQLDAKTLVAMMDTEGALSVMSLIRHQQLQPEGKALANQILAAAHLRSQNPQYIESLIAELKTARGQALRDVIGRLSASQAAAAPQLIKILADPARAEMHDVVSYALTQLGDDMLGPLLASLEANDPALQARVVRVLRHMDRPETLTMLIGPWLSPKTDENVRKQIGATLHQMLERRPTPAEVRHMLHTYALDYYTGRRFVRPDAEDNAIGWRWDANSQQPVSVLLRARDVSMLVAARLARDLFEIAPDDKEYAMLYLAAALEVDGRFARAGLAPPTVAEQAAAEAVKQGPQVLSDVLDQALASGHLYAARSAARLLGQHGNVDILRTADARPSPLVRAVQHRDRRLRFAALEAIMQLNPSGPYPGSSYVAEALSFFVGSRGQRRALVLYSDLPEAQRQAGYLGSIGYEAVSTTSPRQAFKILANSPDYELVLMGVAFRQPHANEFLQILRRDGRTGSLPVGLLVTKDDAEEGERIAKRDALAHVIAVPSNSEQMKERIPILLSQFDTDPVSLAERTAETGKALDWITQITRRPQQLYRLRSLDRQVAQALFDPQLSTKAMVVLSNLGTPATQRALVNLASTESLPIAMRRAAVASFEYSVRRFGLLLETSQIMLQYERYNKSEASDADTQRVLAALLDVVERKALADDDTAQKQPAAPAKKADLGN